MFDFNTEQLAIYKKELEISQSRVKDLERTVEVLTGANQVLNQELERSKLKEEQLLQKIFDFTGLNGRSFPVRENQTEPVKIGQAARWNQVKQNLEVEAKKKYWESKAQQEKINSLEEEVLDGKSDGKDVS